VPLDLSRAAQTSGLEAAGRRAPPADFLMVDDVS
jgi:hypothetical protein